VRKIGFSGQAPKCRALSVRRAAWQSGLAAALLSFAGPLSATPGGELGTMPRGEYICELPGDATGPAGIRVPAQDFSVVTASSYRAGGSMGSYLLTGDQLIMTSGPHLGKRYKRVSQGFVRLLDAQGRPGDVRCVRRKPNNA
jgi:hypothetical protein